MRFAVLIGIDDYDHPDVPPLHAPARDAEAWTQVLLELGVAPQDICLATSPAPTASVVVYPPTTAGVARAMEWLLERLAANEGAEGILFFAGHGDMRADAWGSCFLQDFPGELRAHDGLVADGALHLVHLRPRIPSHARVTVIVDACRAGELPGQSAPVGQGLEATWSDGPVALVTAARLGEESYERRFGDGWRGQFSWAVFTLLREWETRTTGGVRSFAADWAELTRRATLLIAGISATGQDQAPQAVGGLVHGVPVFGPPGGEVLSSPRQGGGHEWPAGTIGVVKSGTTEVGWYKVDAAGTSMSWWFTALPNTWSSLSFTAKTQLGDRTGMQKYVSSASTLSLNGGGGGSNGMSNGNILLAFSADGLTLYWQRCSPQAQSYLPQSVGAMTTGAPFNPNGNPVYGTTDTLTPV